MKFRTKVKIISCLVVFLVLINFDLYGQLTTDKNELKKSLIKLLKQYPIPDNSIKLEKIFSFPIDPYGSEDYFLEDPQSISVDKENNIYITDGKNNSCIFKFDKNGRFISKIGRKGQGPGEFLSIGQIEFDNKDHIIVNDRGNRRIQILDRTGKYLSSFKILKLVNSITVYDDKIFCSHSGVWGRKKTDELGPLITVYNYDGEIIRSFGERPKFGTPIMNRVMLKFNENYTELIVVWELLSMIRSYSIQGDLLKEIKMKRPLLINNERFNIDSDQKMKGNSIMTKGVICGFDIIDNNIYLLSDYPRIEIVKFDRLGNELDSYFYEWSERYDTTTYIIDDFKIINRSDNEIIFYILQHYPEKIVDVYTIGK